MAVELPRQWNNVYNWWTDTTTGIVQIFGWGLILVVVAILTLAVTILSKASLLWRYWNKWLGGLIIAAAIWGLLGLIPGYGMLDEYSLGGRIGQSIVTPYLWIGILIIVFMVIVGILGCHTPRICRFDCRVFQLAGKPVTPTGAGRLEVYQYRSRKSIHRRLSRKQLKKTRLKIPHFPGTNLTPGPNRFTL